MALGLEAAYGQQGGWDTLHRIIAERKKDEILKQREEDARQQRAYEQQRLEEERRQFDVSEQRLSETAGITQARQKQADLVSLAGRIKSASSIGDPLAPDKALALQQAGEGNAVAAMPIIPGVGLIEHLGARASAPPPSGPGAETGGEFLYGGTSAQKHTAQAEQLAEERFQQDQKDKAAAAARGDRALGISEQRLGLAEQQAQEGTSIVERQPDGSYAVVGTMPRGGRLAPNPETTFQRNQKAARQGAHSTIDAVAELSAKINVNQGVIAKVTGTVERAKAQANLNDDVAEYESIIQAFTPLVARALGHTGVLTEQDVQSARRLFPSPTDSKSLRDRKVARMKQFFGEDTPEGAPDLTSAREKYKY
jgi:hypothetical protein